MTGDVTRNLFEALPDARVTESFETLLNRPGARGLRIERIVSQGQASPPDFWYEQPGDEWVVLLRGAAVLRFADEFADRLLKPGDCIDIAAGRRHRVVATSRDEPTVWLAVHTDR